MYKSDYVQTLDQHSQTNLNSSWVNDKGIISLSVSLKSQSNFCLAKSHAFPPSATAPFGDFFVLDTKTLPNRPHPHFLFSSFPFSYFPFLSLTLAFPKYTFSLLGAWVTNVLIVVLIKFFFGIIPGISPELSWSMTTLTYNVVRPILNIVVNLNGERGGGSRTKYHATNK